MTRVDRVMPRGMERARGRRSDAGETRRRLLETGRLLFAEHGFEKVTVRDIARGARANLAAVSYHFRDKLGLYMEVVREGMEVARAFNEELMGALPQASPEDRLRHYVHTYLPRVVHADRTAWIFQLMRHEMANPTAAAASIVESSIMPRIKYLSQIVRDLMGARATEHRTRRCVTSIQAQCLFYAPDPFKKAVFGNWQPRTDAAIRETAEHIVDFSLAGIRAIAARSE